MQICYYKIQPEFSFGLEKKKLTQKRSLTVNKIRTNKLKNIWLTLPANYFAEFKIDQKTRKLG